MKKDLSKEEMLKRLQELEEENKRLKEENSKINKSTEALTKEDAFEALKQLISLSTQTYSSLGESMNMSDRTLRNFVGGNADDGSEKTYGIVGDYYNKQLKEAYQQLIIYRAYASAPNDEQRAELCKKLSLAYDNMLNNLERLIYKKIYTIDERNFKASGEYIDGGFLVYKGSELAYHVLDTTNIRIMRARKELYLDGIIEKDAQTRTVTFLKDYTFKSPTAAAEVICGRAVNGWSKWKSEGKTLDELERNE